MRGEGPSPGLDPGNLVGRDTDCGSGHLGCGHPSHRPHSDRQARPSSPVSTPSSQVVGPTHLSSSTLLHRGPDQGGPTVASLASGGSHLIQTLTTLVVAAQWEQLFYGFYARRAGRRVALTRTRRSEIVPLGKSGGSSDRRHPFLSLRWPSSRQRSARLATPRSWLRPSCSHRPRRTESRP